MIIFSHLLNDRSGSPRILCLTIAALARNVYGSRLFVGSDGSGCLDEASIQTTRYWYWRTPFRLLTLFTYLFSQFCLFVQLFRSRNIDRDAIIYVNTLLPFGAALYGWITGRPVVYHLHEVSVTPAPLRWFLTSMARLTARSLIYVSDFHWGRLPIPGVPAVTVHNALDEAFLQRARASAYLHRHDGQFNVLMLASLRDYKGVPEFLALADGLRGRPHIHFNLVVNDEQPAIKRYFQDRPLPPNVTVHPRTDDPGTHYAEASLVLNLSRPDLCVETFGLTLLEAMAYGVPVLAPPVGGPPEVVRDGEDGFLVDSRNGDELAARVLQLADDEALCLRLSAAARSRASDFSQAAFAQALRAVLAHLTSDKTAT
jgi:L-malate glycosyltransferase